MSQLTLILSNLIHRMKMISWFQLELFHFLFYDDLSWILSLLRLSIASLLMSPSEFRLKKVGIVEIFLSPNRDHDACLVFTQFTVNQNCLEPIRMSRLSSEVYPTARLLILLRKATSAVCLSWFPWNREFRTTSRQFQTASIGFKRVCQNLHGPLYQSFFSETIEVLPLSKFSNRDQIISLSRRLRLLSTVVLMWAKPFIQSQLPKSNGISVTSASCGDSGLSRSKDRLWTTMYDDLCPAISVWLVLERIYEMRPDIKDFL